MRIGKVVNGAAPLLLFFDWSNQMEKAKIKRAETTSSVGAGVLGAGIGVLAAGFLAPVGVPLLAVGLILHAWGMYDKHRLERSADDKPLWWAEALYWVCWLGLGAIALYAFLA